LYINNLVPSLDLNTIIHPAKRGRLIDKIINNRHKFELHDLSCDFIFAFQRTMKVIGYQLLIHTKEL